MSRNLWIVIVGSFVGIFGLAAFFYIRAMAASPSLAGNGPFPFFCH